MAAKGCHQARNMAVASRLRTSSVCSREGQQLGAVEPGQGQETGGGQSSCTDGRHAHQRLVGEDLLRRARRAWPRGDSRAPRGPVADLLDDLARVDGRIHAPVDGEEQVELGAGRPRPPTACPGTGACRRAACRRGRSPGGPGRARRRRRASGRSWRSGFSQSGPSSAIMRRLTKAGPMGGASDCSFCSSSAYSGGRPRAWWRGAARPS
jgi:hypothetical protein